MDTVRIVAVAFQPAGKIFDFNAGEMELEIGAKVIVETDRGRAMAHVVAPPREEVPDSSHPKLKNVLRLANEADLEMAAKNTAREQEALQFCKRRVKERNMEMKLVRAEYLYDGSKIIFYFTADGRVDFRELVRDLAQHFRTRIEMRQIGVRDEAKMVGGLGVCGRELCCCSHLRNFAPVSVKMAKTQGLALNPSKISGQCGRLLCCLGYEYDTYNEFSKKLPKCGKKITLASGPVDVVAVNILAQTITVNENGVQRVIPVSELEGGGKPCAQHQGQPGSETPESSQGGKSPAGQEEKKSNRRRRSRRSKSGTESEDRQGQPERRSKERRSDDRQQAGGNKQQQAEGQGGSDEQKDAPASKSRRRRRRPRNRKKTSPQNDNN